MTDQELVSEALHGLQGTRYRIEAALTEVPNVPGLYAVFGGQGVWEQLGLDGFEVRQPLYIGKAERSLQARDVRTHFTTGKTGGSTLRRSLAALLREDLRLEAIPRNTAKPERTANFSLAADGDTRLTTWMHERLNLAVWIFAKGRLPGVPLDDVETAVIGELQPPLNLMKVAKRLPVLVQARASMAEEARRWERDRGFEI